MSDYDDIDSPDYCDTNMQHAETYADKEIDGLEEEINKLRRQLAQAHAQNADLKLVSGTLDEVNDALIPYLREYASDHISTITAVPHMLKKLAQANETIAKLREAATNEQDHICEWVNGEPSNVYRSEWFIAETTYGDRVVLRELPEDWAYDYTTADGTYLAARKIKRWMQFPDSEFLPYNLPDDYKIVKSADFASANETIGKLLEYGPRVLEALEHTVPSECYATGPLHEDGRDGECVGCAAIKVMGSLIAEAARSQKP